MPQRVLQDVGGGSERGAMKHRKGAHGCTSRHKAAAAGSSQSAQAHHPAPLGEGDGAAAACTQEAMPS